ncbi:transporter [Desulforamulus profundi]|uniref:Transporter n=1 Tax=Desulforamulus profundi TaxID=1383067 RepID=A0A2C6MDU2_9FIRM|nr:RDD family protein [Desulforamulus profundi]MCL5780789.1 RDD family protein [Bacillota bacterium]PHJ39469.1 transporter [Desulforamulus profundi]
MSELQYASPFERLIARIIDKVVITLPIYLWFGFNSNLKTVDYIANGILLVAIVLLNVLWNGQTVGKKVMKIRIQSYQEKKLHIGHYLLREFAFTLYPFYLLTQPIIKTGWLFWMLSTIVLILMYGRGIHDFAARTVVVRTEAKPLPESKES